MSSTIYKLGKLPATRDDRDLLFKNFFRRVTLPTIPDYVGHDSLIEEWGMLGNDVAGDCVIASAGHLIMLWNAMGKRKVKITTEIILSVYSKVTGYDPEDPSTDRGTNMRAFLKYWRKHGIMDSDGNIHKIGAFVRIDPTNAEHMLAAIYLFGAVNAGIKMPDYAMQQFYDNKPWTLSEGKIDGGHCIPIVCRREMLGCVTWGKIQPMSADFFKQYADEAWVIISEEMLSDEGCNPQGFDLQQLKDYLSVL